MKKIMIVDDETDQIFTIKTVFEEEFGDDYKIIGINSGNKCLDFLKNNEVPDLILLDIMMPEMSGWELFDKLKGNPAWKNIPIIFLTARTDRVAKNAGKFLGEDYISKPIDIKNLKNRIDKII